MSQLLLAVFLLALVIGRVHQRVALREHLRDDLVALRAAHKVATEAAVVEDLAHLRRAGAGVGVRGRARDGVRGGVSVSIGVGVGVGVGARARAGAGARAREIVPTGNDRTPKRSMRGRLVGSSMLIVASATGGSAS